MSFYKLTFDDDLTRWQLRISRQFPDGTSIDVWAYRKCQDVHHKRPVPFEIARAGLPVDYNETAFSAIVVSAKLGQIWKSFAPNSVQLLSAKIVNSEEEWHIANIRDCVDCLDHARSLIKYCSTDDPDRPGKPRSVMRLVIDPEKAKGHHLFHVSDWKVVTIVSAELKQAMEYAEISGVEYVPAFQD